MKEHAAGLVPESYRRLHWPLKVQGGQISRGVPGRGPTALTGTSLQHWKSNPAREEGGDRQGPAPAAPPPTPRPVGGAAGFPEVEYRLTTVRTGDPRAGTRESGLPRHTPLGI